MKRLRTIIGLIAFCGMAAFFTGCGGDNNDSTPAPGVAPSSLNGRTYTLNDASTGAIITFSQDANTYSITKDGSTENGTFTAQKNGNTWVVQTTDATQSTTSTLELTFSSDGVGSYVYRRPTGNPVQGAFNASSGSTTTGTTTTGTTTTGTTTTGTTTTGTTTTGTTTTGTTTTGTTTTGTTTTGTTTDGTTTTGTTTTGTTTTGTTTDGTTTTGTTTTGTTTTGPGTVNAPSTAPAQIRVHLTQGVLGGDYTINLMNGGTSGSFNITDGSVGSGNYTYTPNGTSAHLRLDYTGDYQGDYDDMTLYFMAAPGSSTPSSLSGTQFAAPNTGPMAGTFTY